MTSITIGNSVTSIGDNAFDGCIGLTSITIPNSVTNIGGESFAYCSSIASINVESSNPKYDSRDNCNAIIESATNSLLYGCKNTVIPNSVTRIEKSAFRGCISLTSVEIPDSVTSIGMSAFAACEGLASVTIGNNVRSIGFGAFQGCSSMASINVKNSNQKYDSRDNCNAIIESATNSLLYGCKNTVIPNSVTNIGDYAFSYCRDLISINLSDNVTSIGKWSFEGCINLKTINLCRHIETIGEKAFYGCEQLDSVFIHTLVPPSIDSTVFKMPSGNVTATLFVPFESLDAYKAIPEYVSQFYKIEGFSFVEDITATSAVLKWIPEPEVTQYTIDIYQGSDHFAEYLVDGDGHVISSHRYAPAIFHQRLDTTSSTTDYFVLTLNDLSGNSAYTYEINGANSSSENIYHEEGSFHTDDTEGLLPTEADDPRRHTIKFLRNGQLIIRNGDTIYTLQGQEINIPK